MFDFTLRNSLTVRMAVLEENLNEIRRDIGLTKAKVPGLPISAEILGVPVPAEVSGSEEKVK